MLNAYLTTGATTQVYTGKVREVLVTVNAALTGTVTVIDGTTGTTANVAIITNPTVGTMYRYWGFQNGVRIVTSTTCDVTINCDLSFSGT